MYLLHTAPLFCLVIHLEKLNKEPHGHFHTLALADYSVMLLSVLRELACSAWILFSRNVYHVFLGSSHCLPPGLWSLASLSLGYRGS